MEIRRMAAIVAAAAVVMTGCATDDAVEEDARDAAPEVEKVGKEAKDEAGEAGRAVEKEIED
jgi:hypothetical protein